MRRLATACVLALAAWTAAAPQHREAAPAPFQFVNIAPQAGIDAHISHGSPERRWIFEANGSGAACLDYDGDGWLDILLVNGADEQRLRGYLEGAEPEPSASGIYLYRNLGNGRFADVTRQAGLANPYWATGANAADFDGDGDLDLLVTTIGVDLLFENQGDGTFREVGAARGLSREIRWHTGSTFGDIDGDGDLDLFIAGYLDIRQFHLSQPPPVCNYRGIDVFCGPQGLAGEADILYRNNGDGTFTDIAAGAGVADRERLAGFAALFEDLDQDGWPDLFVANDSGPNLLYWNRQGRFEEAGLESGVAFNAAGKTQADMGIAAGDADGDGSLDLFTTTFSEDYFPLFLQIGPGLFEDSSHRLGLGASTVPMLGWAVGFADFDNDGDLDLWSANGHVYPDAGRLATTQFHQPVAFWENRGGRFVPVRTGDFGAPDSWRGGCAGDFNNDGRIDLLIVPIDGKPLLLENRTAGQGAWIGLDLVPRNGREAIGARVTVEGCGQRWVRTVANGGSYLSRNDSRVHIGLGTCSNPVTARIRWPDGSDQTISSALTGSWTRLRQE